MAYKKKCHYGNASQRPASLPPPPPPPPPPLPQSAKHLSNVNIRLKQMNWKPLAKHHFAEGCFWKEQQGVNVYCSSEEEDILDGLAQHFALPILNVAQKTAEKSKIDLRVLDRISVQNLLIVLRVSFKDTSYEQIKQHILRCETTKLNSDFIEKLIKSLPTPDKMKELCELNNRGIQLLAVEKFVASLGDIKQLIPRLDCMKFMICFNDMAEDLEHDILTVTSACNEIIASKKFGKILTVILSICNLMNPGFQTIGFELDILKRLHDMKSSHREYTLLHFVVEAVYRKYPECLNLADEMAHVGKATRVNSDDIKQTIEKVIQSSENLQILLKDIGGSQSSGDKFEEQMSPFALKAHHQVDMLKKMMHDMHNTYLNASKYFAFDVKTCSMDDFITNINNFKTQFAKAYAEILILQKKGMPRRSFGRQLQKPVNAKSGQHQVLNAPIVDAKVKRLCKGCTVKLKRLSKQDIVAANQSGKRKRRQQ
ncbi:protein diaphanous-like [Sitodiplosis mosellana]|uniref:protein diaphanous-like n=1 Tax=Sitodiplosis mosellana TaxID=263140 RepID=UPI0024445E6D|nr:protein diaphanous-like [Sitodiplosis mosellana]